jgi:hypothetical protein
MMAANININKQLIETEMEREEKNIIAGGH